MSHLSQTATLQVENAIRALQDQFVLLAEAADYDLATNEFRAPTELTIALSASLHAAWENLAAAIDVDVGRRPDLTLIRKWEVLEFARGN